jgi:hypothetical protein
MPLKSKDRKKTGAPAVVASFKDFQQNFNLFSESALTDLDWSNVVAAGSAVTTALLPVPEKWAESKRSMREYYHEHLAPASDVDLFLYGLNEEQALEKIKQIEKNIKDSILHETTTIRTKNAITIASQHPTRHVQIVLRLYDSISQIITGFDVDCACAAYEYDNKINLKIYTNLFIVENKYTLPLAPLELSSLNAIPLISLAALLLTRIVFPSTAIGVLKFTGLFSIVTASIPQSLSDRSAELKV